MEPCFTVIEPISARDGAFGIAMSAHGHLLDVLPDVTARRADAEEIAQKLNQNRAAAVHFRDIVYDWITERALL